MIRVPTDVGGLPSGPIDQTPHEKAVWEKRVDALMMILARENRITVDEIRFAIERLGEKAYSEMAYYERWIEAICQSLIQRGLLTVEEVSMRIGELEAKGHE